MGCGIGWSDGDGDLPQYLYQWQRWVVDRYENIVGETGNKLGPGNFVRGTSIRVQVTPFDGYATGTPVPGTLVISNSPPSVGSVALAPVIAYNHTDLTGTPQDLADADGDSVTAHYQWQKWNATANDWADLDGQTASTLAASFFAKHDRLNLVVRPWDGLDHGLSLIHI